MNAPVSTVAESLLSMAPGLAISLLACMAWYFICRLLMRRQDAEWYAALPTMPVPEAEQGSSYDVQIKAVELRLAYLHVHAYALRRGRPSDRLFAFGLLAAGGIAMTGVAFLFAITLD